MIFKIPRKKKAVSTYFLDHPDSEFAKKGGRIPTEKTIFVIDKYRYVYKTGNDSQFFLKAEIRGKLQTFHFLIRVVDLPTSELKSQTLKLPTLHCIVARSESTDLQKFESALTDLTNFDA